MVTTEAFAPAKINLTLHVTGQRSDGYHLLDSYVVFADVGDTVRVTRSEEMALTVVGPFAEGVPSDETNLCWKAAERFGLPVAIELDKQLPAAAGVGGGSSDAAAAIRALEQMSGQTVPFDPIVLGADVPVCTVAHAAHMQGIGDYVLPLFMEPMHAVLVNPGVPVPTGAVFDALDRKSNPPMEPWPEGGGPDAAVRWLGQQRNDLQAPAIALQPVIGAVLEDLAKLAGCQLARMSGSGATCFGLFESETAAANGAATLRDAHPDWWVTNCHLR